MNFLSKVLLLLLIFLISLDVGRSTESVTAYEITGKIRNLILHGECKAIVVYYNPVSCKSCYNYIDKEILDLIEPEENDVVGLINITGIKDIGYRKDLENYLRPRFNFFNDIIFGIPQIDSSLTKPEYLPNLILIDECKSIIHYFSYEDLFEEKRMEFSPEVKFKLKEFLNKSE